MNVAVVQMRAEPLDVAGNLARAADRVAEAARRGAQLVVLPEMFDVGFYFGDGLMALATPLDGPTVDWMRAQARRHQAHLIGSIYERWDGDFFNTMVLAAPDGGVQSYRKRNPTWVERAMWRRADQPGPGIFDTTLGRIGGAICFDSFTRETLEGFARSRVQLVVVVALWGVLEAPRPRVDMGGFASTFRRWSELAAETVPSHLAATLGAPVAFCNQVGIIETPVPRPAFFPGPALARARYRFWGRSNLRDASGIIRGRAAADRESIELATLALPSGDTAAPIDRRDVPADWLSPGYYSIAPPLLARLGQAWMYRGLASEYERRRRAV